MFDYRTVLTNRRKIPITRESRSQAVFEPPLPGRAGPFLKGELENELKSAEINFEKAQRTVFWISEFC